MQVRVAILVMAIRRIRKKPKKIVKKKIVKKKKKIIKKSVAKKSKPKRKKSKNPLANALMASGTSMYPTQSKASSLGSNVTKMIHKLYGKEFNGYSKTQKKIH